MLTHTHTHTHRTNCQTCRLLLLTPPPLKEGGNTHWKCNCRRRHSHNCETSERPFEKHFVSYTYVAYTCMYDTYVRCEYTHVVSTHNTHVHTYTRADVCMYIHMYVCIYVGMSVYIYLYIYTHTNPNARARARALAHTCKYINRFIYILEPVRR